MSPSVDCKFRSLALSVPIRLCLYLSLTPYFIYLLTLPFCSHAHLCFCVCACVCVRVRVRVSVCACSAVDSEPPSSFQWYRNGELIPSATSDEYVVRAVGDTEACKGVYHCVASNAVGSVTSDNAEIDVIGEEMPVEQAAPPPLIVRDNRPKVLAQPAPPHDDLLYNERVAISLEYDSLEPVSFQWLRNGQEIDAKSGELVIPAMDDIVRTLVLELVLQL